MGYLNIPRLHFSGRFLADPSTLNNEDANFDPAADPTDDDLGWNATGTHNWQLLDCTVQSIVDSRGAITDSQKDPLIGALVLSAGEYPAKLVDLDPDNQGVSQIGDWC